METATTSGFQDGPSLEVLDRRLFREWDLGADRAAAVGTAREIAIRVDLRSTSLLPETDYWRVSHAAETLWDSDLADEALRLASDWRGAADKICETAGIDPTGPRIWALILSARAEHRARNFGGAVDWAKFAISEIRRVFGVERLARELRLGVVSPATELYCAALAIAIPAGRMRFGEVPTLRAQLLDAWIADAQLLLGADEPPKLRRVHAVVIQTFYALAEREWSRETEDWLARLLRFDDLTRPSHDRGQRTKTLRDEVFARYKGEGQLAERLRAEAADSLAALPRHLKALRLNGWWP